MTKKVLYTDFTGIDEVISDILEDKSFKKAITRNNLFKFWKQIVGDKFKNKSKPYSMTKDSVMVIACDNSVTAQELMLRIDMLLKHRDYLDNSSYPFGNTYISSVESDLEGIAKYLKDNKGQISRVLEWCKTYESMKEKVLGDVDERGYQKRKKQ